MGDQATTEAALLEKNWETTTIISFAVYAYYHLAKGLECSAPNLRFLDEIRQRMEVLSLAHRQRKQMHLDEVEEEGVEIDKDKQFADAMSVWTDIWGREFNVKLVSYAAPNATVGFLANDGPDVLGELGHALRKVSIRPLIFEYLLEATSGEHPSTKFFAAYEKQKGLLPDGSDAIVGRHEARTELHKTHELVSKHLPLPGVVDMAKSLNVIHTKFLKHDLAQPDIIQKVADVVKALETPMAAFKAKAKVSDFQGIYDKYVVIGKAIETWKFTDAPWIMDDEVAKTAEKELGRLDAIIDAVLSNSRVCATLVTLTEEWSPHHQDLKELKDSLDSVNKVEASARELLAYNCLTRLLAHSPSSNFEAELKQTIDIINQKWKIKTASLPKMLLTEYEKAKSTCQTSKKRKTASIAVEEASSAGGVGAGSPTGGGVASGTSGEVTKRRSTMKKRGVNSAGVGGGDFSGGVDGVDNADDANPAAAGPVAEE